MERTTEVENVSQIHVPSANEKTNNDSTQKPTDELFSEDQTVV
jgi:hypothetical protein